MNRSSLLSVTTSLVVAAVVSVVLVSITFPVEDMREYVNESEEWCHSQDGELYNAMVMGDHGGLHCELPNGTVVHMDDVRTPDARPPA